MPEAAEQLAYGRASTWNWRRVLRWAIVPVGALVIGFFATRDGPLAVRHLRNRSLQRHCLDYTPAPGRVIYDNDPDGDGFAPAAAFEKYAAYRNGAFEAYQRSYMPPVAVAFMGRRTSPAGNERLVTVPFLQIPPGEPESFLQFIFGPEVEIPASVLRRAARATSISLFRGDRLELFAVPGDRLRILEGLPDPADSAHFTIDYVHNGVPGTIDGWLNDDDTVTLGPRAGEFVEQSSTFLRWSPARGGLPPGLTRGNWVLIPGTGGAVLSTPPVVDPTTRPVVPKKDDRRFR